MIAYTYIERNLRSLDARYRSRRASAKDAKFTSKLAILELCGWIEVSMDECILRAGDRVLRSADTRLLLQREVGRIYGFEYEKHFRSMMIQIVGIWGFEKIRNSIGTSISTRFSTELNTLKHKRNSLAHTYTHGVTSHYDAPSVTLGSFAIIKSGLKAYDSAIREYCR